MRSWADNAFTCGQTEGCTVGRAKEVVIGINDPQATEKALIVVRRAAPAAHVLVRTRYAAARVRRGASSEKVAEPEL